MIIWISIYSLCCFGETYSTSKHVKITVSMCFVFVDVNFDFDKRFSFSNFKPFKWVFIYGRLSLGYRFIQSILECLSIFFAVLIWIWIDLIYLKTAQLHSGPHNILRVIQIEMNKLENQIRSLKPESETSAICAKLSADTHEQHIKFRMEMWNSLAKPCIMVDMH